MREHTPEQSESEGSQVDEDDESPRKSESDVMDAIEQMMDRRKIS